MHPDLFSTFDDIGGDRGPNSGTKQQTIERLYGGDAAAWAAFDPRTVMAKHGPYIGVAGYFDDSQEPADDKTKNLPDRRLKRDAPVGFGGHDDADEFREKGALPDLCAAALKRRHRMLAAGVSGLPHLAIRREGFLQRLAMAGRAGAHARGLTMARGLWRQNFATAPASIGSAAPVMYCASSEARKSTALLTARASITGFGSR